MTQKSAWFMLHRIRMAMQTGTFQKLDGEVEVDETFIGGKAPEHAQELDDYNRFAKVLGTVAGRRLTYTELTGKS